PHRHRPQTLDRPLEGRPQRLRHRLRRPPHRRPQLTRARPSYTVNWTHPRASSGGSAASGGCDVRCVGPAAGATSGDAVSADEGWRGDASSPVVGLSVTRSVPRWPPLVASDSTLPHTHL